MRFDKIINGTIQIDMPLEEMNVLWEREGFSDQTPDALAQGEVVAFDIGGVDLEATALGFDDHSNVIGLAKHNAPSYFYHPPTPSPLVDLGITQLWVQDALGLFAGAARTPLNRQRLGGTVVGHQRGDVARKFVTGKEGGSPSVRALNCWMKAWAASSLRSWLR